MQEILDQIKQAIISRDIKAMAGLVDQALEQGVAPEVLVNDGLVAAMDVVGEQFGNKEIFVPEMLVSAKLMSNSLAKVKPLMVSGADSGRGTVMMCTVKGDLHDIGKNLVTMMMEGAGFKVYDLGVDVTADQVAAKVAELKPQVLGLSALLTTTMPEMEKVINILTEMGIRNDVKVMVGGAPVSQDFANKIGADGYGEDAGKAVALARAFVG